MKLVFLSYPVKNLKESLEYYRTNFGMEEAWREGELTAAMKLEGTDVKLMLDQDDEGMTAGGVFLVDSVDEFYKEYANLDFIREPFDIPPGRYAIFKDNAGNVNRVIDMTKEK
ncbi:MAG TPA: VOC family protein [Bacillales bacterium]|nr:VOC family protein [Bacillales bacterium]